MSFSELLSSVKELIASRVDDPRQRVIDGLAEKEVERRANILSSLLDAYKSTKSDLDKTRPPKMFTPEGNEVVGNYTAEEHGRAKKLRERLQKIDQAYAKACEGDYQQAEKLAKGGKGGKGGDDTD